MRRRACARGVEVEVHLYPAGHHANDVDEQIRHMELILEFFAATVTAAPTA